MSAAVTVSGHTHIESLFNKKVKTLILHVCVGNGDWRTRSAQDASVREW